MAKVVFISAFMSPHIKPLCDILYNKFRGDFVYIQMQHLTNERQALGYAYDKEEIPYVIDLTDNYKEQKRAVDDAECVIINTGTTTPILVEDRIRNNKITLFANERLLKRGILKFLDKRLWTQWRINLLGRDKRLYLLCFGAYVKQDFELIGFPKNRSFKFGYFPEQTKMDYIPTQNRNEISIAWVGRMIDWKRPVFALKVMKELKRKSVPYHLSMIGEGTYFEAAKRYAKANGLNVTFYGTLSNLEVRKKMFEADVLLSTSNRREGWGAVVNEALSVETPVIASRDIGCVPYLISGTKNGLSYKTYSYKDAAKCINRVNEMERDIIEDSISETLKLWNSKVAADRLCEIIDRLMNQKPVMDYFEEGPLSKA